MKIRKLPLLVVAAFASRALARDVNPEPIVVPAGTNLVLVFESTVSSASARVGDVVISRLGDDVKNGQETLLRAGSELRGRVTSVKRSGKVKGKAELQVEFDTIEVKGRSYKMEVTPVDETAKASKGRDAKIIGGVAGAGALIGGVAAGGTGLLKGLLIGGAAGTGGVLFTRGREVVFEQGSRHSVTLESGLRLR
jgi:hypothetical protein